MNSQAEVDVLEKALGVQVPAVYREFLAAYPDSLGRARYSDDTETGGPKDFEMLSSCNRIQRLNQRTRKYWSRSDYAEAPLPESYLLIGEDGSGNLYAIDTAESSGQVLEFDHELGEWTQRAPSLEEFGRQLLDAAAELRSAQN